MQNLDASITLLQNEGRAEIASAMQELTQALLDSAELEASAKNEVAEQLAFLMGQVHASRDQRSTGMIRSVLGGVREAVTAAAGLIPIWERLEPLLRAALAGG